jgi:uncharacterized circularly permuted ATP-grasp superfamily protein
MAWPSDYDATSSYDEMVDAGGQPRPGSVDVQPRLEALGPELFRRQEAAETAIRSMGVTFSLYSEGANIDRSWPVDVVPRIIDSREWDQVSRGLIQRMFVLEDNLRIPSGVSYMLENRQVSKRVLADLFRDLDVLPVDGYLERLGTMLRDLSPRDDAEPVVVVLTPGIHNAAYYEHVLLAARIGAHLVEGSDLPPVTSISDRSSSRVETPTSPSAASPEWLSRKAP